MTPNNALERTVGHRGPRLSGVTDAPSCRKPVLNSMPYARVPDVSQLSRFLPSPSMRRSMR